MSYVDLYISFRSIWRSSVPAGLRDEDPEMLLKLLDHADPKTGTTQTDLMRELTLLQGKAGTLMAALRKAHWLEDMANDTGDKRMRRVRVTGTARQALSDISVAMSLLLVKPKVDPLRRHALRRDFYTASLLDPPATE